MLALAALGALALGALALGGRRRRRSGGDTTTATGSLCDTTPATAATFTDRARLLAWVDCPTRTVMHVAELERLLNSNSRTDEARRVRARWNARRTVEDGAPTGTIQDTAERRAADTAATAERPPADAPPAPIPGPDGGPTHPLDGGATYHGGGGDTGIPAYTMERGEPTVVRPGSRSRARALAAETARALERRENYRSILRRFQTAAGLTVDGIYGGRTYNALRHFGITSPPTEFRPPSHDSPDAAYTPPTAE